MNAVAVLCVFAPSRLRDSKKLKNYDSARSQSAKPRAYGKIPISVYERATLSMALMNAADRRLMFRSA
jgi:hypothetical protein